MRRPEPFASRFMYEDDGSTCGGRPPARREGAVQAGTCRNTGLASGLLWKPLWAETWALQGLHALRTSPTQPGECAKGTSETTRAPATTGFAVCSGYVAIAVNSGDPQRGKPQPQARALMC